MFVPLAVKVIVPFSLTGSLSGQWLERLLQPLHDKVVYSADDSKYSTTKEQYVQWVVHPLHADLWDIDDTLNPILYRVHLHKRCPITFHASTNYVALVFCVVMELCLNYSYLVY